MGLISRREWTRISMPGVPSASRAFDRGTRLARRHTGEIADEFRERRLALGESQEHVADACQMSRVHYGQIENGQVPKLTILEVDRIASVLGLAPSIRLYPAGPAVRDAGQLLRLQAFLDDVRPPLSYRIEVPLPPRDDRTDQRAWDAVLYGGGVRTAIELEMRLRDVQALLRRIDLKRRDDPTESFVLLVADTRNNRRVLAEFANLFADLPRLRPSVVHSALASGSHPATGILLI
jgi:transcriptional regulator with XRE-family HTH domain